MVQRKGSANGTRGTVHCKVTIWVSRGDGVENILRNTCMEDTERQRKKQNESEKKIVTKGLGLQNVNRY